MNGISKHHQGTYIRPLIVLLLIFFSAYSYSISDFAPTKIGNIWKYDIKTSWSGHSANMLMKSISDTFQRTIQLNATSKSNDTCYYIFHVKDSGFSTIDSSNQNGLNIHNVVPVMKETLDTFYQFNDSLTIFDLGHIHGYDIRFSPLYVAHSVSSDEQNLSSIIFNGMPYFQVITSYNGIALKYLQNTGLDSAQYSINVGSSRQTCSINLISFNVSTEIIKKNILNQTIRLEPKYNSINASIFYDISGRKLSLINLKSKSHVRIFKCTQK